jgi:anti-anti-sigma factor
MKRRTRIPMKHETRDHEGCTVVAFEGDIDLQSSPNARSALLDAVAGGKAVLVDLSGVSYIDSSGVASWSRASKAPASPDAPSHSYPSARAPCAF